jgi:hypothetical protein
MNSVLILKRRNEIDNQDLCEFYVIRTNMSKWTSHATLDKLKPQFEAISNASGLTPPEWLWRRVQL